MPLVCLGRNLQITPVMLGILCATFGPFELAFGLWFAIALRRKNTWARHPVVTDAPMPPLRFPEPPEQSPRQCARCGASAKLKSVVRHRVQGLPMGTEWTYSCASCAHTFTLSSLWRSMKPELIFILLLGAVIVQRLVHDSVWLLGPLGAVFALMIYGTVTARGLMRRYPLAPAADIPDNT